jgi:SAM-dependent methyltransferase
MENILIKNNTAGNAWFKSWFDSDFYRQLYGNRNEKEAAGFIDELLNELQPANGSAMLDLGCGNGRHSKYLAAKGFHVTGIDLASSAIRQAKKWESCTLRFYRHDMRVPFGNECFDHVFSFFTSFGYFKTRAEDHKVLENISASLKPNGILVLDYINTDHAEACLVAKEEKEIDGIIYHISRWTDEHHFFKKIVIENMQQEKPLEFTEQVSKFRLADLDQLFRKHGLMIQQVFGNYQLDEYDVQTSPRLILTAKNIKHEK